ncbi:MAG TPA: SCO1664 family protein [Kineosporiaceae bacterium]|nr:SCO1664 family protein [Kineosporiaceae bacterium]
MGAAAPVPGEELDEDAVLDLLSRGELEVCGRLISASNTTLLARVRLDGLEGACVYKPVAGERPLWDFPSRTLARREAAAYLLSAVAGWNVVPPTVLRDGPMGTGSVQWWVHDGRMDGDGDPMAPEAGGGLVDVLDPGEVPPGWRRVLEAESMDGSAVVLAHADHDALRRMAVFDVVANNADRKGGHVLRDASGTVFGVDHGLTFHAEHKLRTVLWGWSGERLTAAENETLARLLADLDGDGPLATGLARLLDPEEVAGTRHRAARLLSAGRHPRPAPGRPAIPWPAF